MRCGGSVYAGSQAAGPRWRNARFFQIDTGRLPTPRAAFNVARARYDDGTKDASYMHLFCAEIRCRDDKYALKRSEAA